MFLKTTFISMAETLHLLPPEVWPRGARITLAPSKSLANRALILSAQAEQSIHLWPATDADDVQHVVDFLKARGQLTYSSIGYDVHATSPNAEAQQVYVGLAGTASRFLVALCTQLPGQCTIVGEPRLHERPIQPLFEALEGAGAQIHYLNTYGKLPVRVAGKPGCLMSPLKLDASLSSQFLSAILLLAPGLPIGFEVWLRAPLASESYASMTLAVCRDMGLHWEPTEKGFLLYEKKQMPSQYHLEADWSSASYLIGHAFMGRFELCISGLSGHSYQGDATQLKLWTELGLEFRWQGAELLVKGNHGPIPPFDFDFGAMPDLAQTFAIVATQATGVCILRGLATLRHKETDRVHALEVELNSLGIKTQATHDTLQVYPGGIKPTRPTQTYQDHRMALAFSMLGAVLPEGIHLEAPSVVGKSYPAFWRDIQSLGYRVLPAQR